MRRFTFGLDLPLVTSCDVWNREFLRRAFCEWEREATLESLLIPWTAKRKPFTIRRQKVTTVQRTLLVADRLKGRRSAEYHCSERMSPQFLVGIDPYPFPPTPPAWYLPICSAFPVDPTSRLAFSFFLSSTTYPSPSVGSQPNPISSSSEDVTLSFLIPLL